MSVRRLIVMLCLVLPGFVLAATGCGPEFPKCNSDEDCKDSEKGQKQNKLMCVNGLCQQCATDADCGDPGQQCVDGLCEQIPNYCTSVDDCPGDQKCRDNRCGPECRNDDECPDEQICKAGSCTAPTECTTDNDCAADQVCRQGECVADTGATNGGPCTLQTVYFAYDSASLSSEVRETLQNNARCIKKRELDVLLTGHTDERGSFEYNIALGERRARTVYDYLKTLGVEKESMRTISYGEEQLARQCGESASDSCHRQNRRVAFTIE
jgi:peptidoglycan-associated lipoprotein